MSEDNYSLSSRVFHTIRENILSGKYATDEELKEKSIGEELGVSRTPVREALRHLEGLVDIYLPDLKYFSPELSTAYSHAPDYAEVAKAAIAEMVRQTGKAVFVNGDEDNLILRGTIVRHLTLPGCMEDSMQILKYLHETYGDTIYISIMNQFTPTFQSGKVSGIES